MSEKQTKHNNLYGIAKLVLFLTSYLPLFILIAFKQICNNAQFLCWCGISQATVGSFFIKFGLSVLLIIISMLSLVGCKLLFFNLQKDVKNGDNVTIIKISNRNGDSIGYIATYIIPFIFQGFNTVYEVFALLFLLFIIYRIYINSSLLLVNPVINFKYSIFEIEYEEQNGKRKSGMIIMRNANIEEGSIVKIYSIGFKLFFADRHMETIWHYKKF